MPNEVLVKVEGFSKKFCRSPKRSLWYGVQDVSAELFGRKGRITMRGHCAGCTGAAQARDG